MTDPRATSTWKRARAAWAVEVDAGNVTCRRCGLPIAPTQRWELGHPVDMPAITHGAGVDVLPFCAPEHASPCNAATGAAARAAAHSARVVDAPSGALW